MTSEIDEIRAIVTEAENDWWCPTCDAFAEATAGERCTVCESQLGEHTTAHAKALLAAYDTERALREALEEQLRAVEREKFAGYVAGGLQRHPHDAELRAHIDAETARAWEALQAMRERAEKAERERDEARGRLREIAQDLRDHCPGPNAGPKDAEEYAAEAIAHIAAIEEQLRAVERERGPAITRADARELLEMSDLSTSDACYERVRAALREYAGSDFECHQPNPLDATIARAEKAERERDEAREGWRLKSGDAAELRERAMAAEAQLAQAKADGAREALERVEYELYARTAMHVPERMETIRILRKMVARLAGEEPKS